MNKNNKLYTAYRRLVFIRSNSHCVEGKLHVPYIIFIWYSYGCQLPCTCMAKIFGANHTFHTFQSEFMQVFALEIDFQSPHQNKIKLTERSSTGGFHQSSLPLNLESCLHSYWQNKSMKRNYLSTLNFIFFLSWQPKM